MVGENRDDLIRSVEIVLLIRDRTVRPNACLLLMHSPGGVERFLFPLSDAFDGLRDLRLAAMRAEGFARDMEKCGFQFHRQIVHLDGDDEARILGTWQARTPIEEDHFRVWE